MVSTELLVRAALAGWRDRPRSASTTGRGRRASRAGGDPRVILRAFRERRALLRRLRAERGAGARRAARARRVT